MCQWKRNDSKYGLFLKIFHNLRLPVAGSGQVAASQKNGRVIKNELMAAFCLTTIIQVINNKGWMSQKRSGFCYLKIIGDFGRSMKNGFDRPLIYCSSILYSEHQQPLVSIRPLSVPIHTLPMTRADISQVTTLVKHQ